MVPIGFPTGAGSHRAGRAVFGLFELRAFGGFDVAIRGGRWRHLRTVHLAAGISQRVLQVGIGRYLIAKAVQ